MLAVLMGMPGIASAQTQRAGPPRIDVVTLQRREADDMALLLQLRAAQRPALDAFLQSFAPPPAMPHGDKMREAMPSDGFEQHLQRMTEMTAQRAADDTRRIAAARSFYDGLDTKQRAAFEALMRLRHGPAMMGPPMIGPSMMGPPMMRACRVARCAIPTMARSSTAQRLAGYRLPQVRRCSCKWGRAATSRTILT